MTRRRLDPDERALWTHVTRSVKRLDRRRVDAAAIDELPAATAPPRAKDKIKTLAKAQPVAAAPAPRPHPPAAAAPLGRKAKRRLARGAEAIDGRLDLHGMTQDQAHGALLRFLRGARGRGERVVLVITGKGARASDGHSERGVLKRQVPMWLQLPEFRELVVGFEAAAIAHGGDGAMYVRVRRTRD